MATATAMPSAPTHEPILRDPTTTFAITGRNDSSDSSRTSDISSEKANIRAQQPRRKSGAKKAHTDDYVVDRSVSPNRLKTFLKAFKHIRDLTPQQVDDFMASYEIYNLDWADEEAMIAAFGPDYQQRVGRCLAAYYSVINHLCSLGDVEKMYIPPLMNKKASVRDNQLLCEESIAREIGLKPGMRVLDLGCGRGRVAAHMTSFSGATVTGINSEFCLRTSNLSYIYLLKYLHVHSSSLVYFVWGSGPPAQARPLGALGAPSGLLPHPRTVEVSLNGSGRDG